MIKNIIFDIGNVLTDFRWREFLQDKGFDENMVERIARASILSPFWSEFDRGEWSDERLMEEFIKSDPQIEEQLHRAYDNIHGIVTIREYAIPWVKELKEKGYKVWYLSNFAYKTAVECADSLTFIPYMDGGILSYQDKVVKPDPAIYKLFLERFKLTAKECVFLDDTLKNIEAAEAVGIHGICFKTKEQAEEELRKLGVE